MDCRGLFCTHTTGVSLLMAKILLVLLADVAEQVTVVAKLKGIAPSTDKVVATLKNGETHARLHLEIPEDLVERW